MKFRLTATVGAAVMQNARRILHNVSAYLKLRSNLGGGFCKKP